ncbi:MAG: ATP-binding protein [Sulfolobales archaeon]|nr:ATP-binding protein [Sulfolobales archaeon]
MELLKLDDVKVFDDGLIIFRKSSKEVCSKKIIKVNNIVTSINDLSEQEVLKYLKTYFNSLNLGFPIEVRTIFKPLDKEKVISEINRKIQNLLITIDVNPSNVKAKTDLDRLTKFKDKILKHNIQPYDVLAYYVVEACSNSEENAVKLVNSRTSLLTKTLESLGIMASELRGIEGRILLQMFFRGYTYGLHGLITKLLNWKYFFRKASTTLTVFNPHIITSRTRFDLRSSGVYLGINVLTSEGVYWNIEGGLNPHVLVIGPSGIGKTETLITMLIRVCSTYSTKVFVVDIKNEYRERLFKRGYRAKVINLGVDVGLGVGQVIKLVPKTFRATYLTEVISDSMLFREDKELTATLYRVLSDSFEFLDENLSNFWGVIKDVSMSIDNDYLQYKLMRMLNVMEALDRGKPLITAINEPESITVVNLSNISVLGVDYLNLSMSIFFNTLQLLYMSNVSEGHIPKVQLVVDEAWQFLLSKAQVLLKLLKLGRGYGVSVALATQSLYDLGDLSKEYVENAGLLIALPSPDTLYWRELSKYMRISYDEVREYSLALSKGDALIRILPDPRPIPVKLDHEV